MSDDTRTPGDAGADDGASATFDQTGGLMDQYTGENKSGETMGGEHEFGNPLRPGGQRGEVGDVDDGEQPHLDPDEDTP